MASLVRKPAVCAAGFRFLGTQAAPSLCARYAQNRKTRCTSRAKPRRYEKRGGVVGVWRRSRLIHAHGVVGWGGEFRPNVLPVCRAKVPSRELASTFFFNASAVGHRNAPLPPFIDCCPAQAETASKCGLEAAPIKKNNPVTHVVSMA